jgi:predicted  nucleic acid-binding Zn-ribbon protein
MAEDTPIAAPVEAGEIARAEKPAEKKSETETVDDKPAGKHPPIDVAGYSHTPFLIAVSRSGSLISVRPKIANSLFLHPESAAATDDKKDAEAEADKPAAAEESSESKADGNDAAPADAEAAAPAEANGTPASAKKSSKSRRVSGGANQSKLSRKKSVTRITHLDAKPGQYYLARLRSYAPWPSIICDDEILPESLLENRPVTAMQKDGSYKGEYADGGRRTHERTFPVMFFETNEL